MNKKRANLVLTVVFISICFIFYSMGVASAARFETNKDAIALSLPRGNYQEAALNITSNDNMAFEVSYSGDSGINVINGSFNLRKGEENSVIIGFDSTKLEEGDYFGRIIIKGNDELKVIPVIFKVESPSLFFSGEVQIPLKYQIISPGKDLIGQIKVYDLTASKGELGLGVSSKSVVSLDFKIYNENGSIISDSVENITLINYLQVSKTISINSDVPPGFYFLSVDVLYNSAKAGSATNFMLVKNGIFSNFNKFVEDSLYFVVGGLVLLVILAGIAFLILSKMKKMQDLLKSRAEMMFKEK